DTLGDNAVIFPVFACDIAGNILLALWPTMPGVVLAGVLTGLGFGSLMPCLQAITVKSVPMNRVPVATASFFLLLDAGSGVGPVILGALYPLTGGSGMFLVCAGLVVAAIGVYIGVHGHRRGGRPGEEFLAWDARFHRRRDRDSLKGNRMVGSRPPPQRPFLRRTRMKFALAQINSTTSVPENLDKVRTFTREAAEAGARFIVFPEATMSAFGPGLRAMAEEHADSWRAALKGLAAEAGITVIIGEFGAAADKVINLLAVYTPDGDRRDYAKIHLY